MNANETGTFKCQAIRTNKNLFKTIEISKAEIDVNIPKHEYYEFEYQRNMKIPCEIFAPKIHELKWFLNGEEISENNMEFQVIDSMYCCVSSMDRCCQSTRKYE